MAKFFAENGADFSKSLFQLVTTMALFLGLLTGIGVLFSAGLWPLALLAAPIAGGLLVRLFIFQHDCGHGSFFQSKSANEIVGHIISVLTLTPYDHWRRSHAGHHASSGNLDQRGVGDVPTKTVREYEAMTPKNQLFYRIFRNPLFMIMIGAPVNFIILQRLPLGRGFRNREARRSIMLLNLLLVGVFGGAMALFGVSLVLTVYMPVMIIAAWIGGFLFYVQHQFEDVYWESHEAWDFEKASLAGSSYLELPRVLQWFTGNIGLHHIHHLCCRVPNYRLQACHDQFPELRSAARRITIGDSLECFRLALWCEASRRLISFRELRRRRAVPAE